VRVGISVPLLTPDTRFFPGKTIATILCDGAYRYQSRLFSKKWLETNELAKGIPEHLRKSKN